MAVLPVRADSVLRSDRNVRWPACHAIWYHNTDGNSLVLPLIEEIASCIYEYCYSSKHRWIFYYCETISCKFSFYCKRQIYKKKKDNCLLRQTIVILASSRQWSSSSVFIAVKKKKKFLYISQWVNLHIFFIIEKQEYSKATRNSSPDRLQVSIEARYLSVQTNFKYASSPTSFSWWLLWSTCLSNLQDYGFKGVQEFKKKFSYDLKL